MWLFNGSILLNLLTSSWVSAQIVPDETLPRNSLVILRNNNFRIELGTRRGNNLFHSFKEFSIPTGYTASFNNNRQIENIFSRVTGSSISNIDGMIKANGTANLFLINPNGIVFGPNASLNIGGSFIASTANRVIFSDRFEYSAIDFQTNPLLTITVPIGLGFGATPRQIVNQSRFKVDSPVIGRTENAGTFNIDPYIAGLEVKEGKSLVLVGGNVIFNGGNLTTNGGRIEIGSVAGNSIVNLSETETGWELDYSRVEDFRDIGLIAPTIIDSSSETGGAIRLRGRRIVFTGQEIDSVLLYSNTVGKGKGESIEVGATESIEVEGNISGIATYPETTGIAGDILVGAEKITIVGGELIKSYENFEKEAQLGNLSINFSKYILDEDAIILPIGGIPIEESATVIQTIVTETLVTEEPIYHLDEGVVSALFRGKGSNNLDTENLVIQNICTGQEAGRSSLTVTGRGGLPPNPSDPLMQDATVEWATRSQGENRPPVILRQRIETQRTTIQTIQGWFIAADGTIILTANPTSVTPQPSLFSLSICN